MKGKKGNLETERKWLQIHTYRWFKKYHHLEYPQRSKEAIRTMEQEQMQLKMVTQETKTFSKLKKITVGKK